MSDIKQRVALSSIAASAGLTTAKGVVGVMSGSLALLSEAAHSFIDLGATVMTYFAVRSSGKPADAEHHYGHGKIESVSALAETALLFILAGIVIWEAAKRLMSAQPPEVEATPWAFAVILLSILVDFLRARVLYRTAEKTSSHALEADALFERRHAVERQRAADRNLQVDEQHLADLPHTGRFGGGDSGIAGHLHRGMATRPAYHRHPNRYRAARSGRKDHCQPHPHPRCGRN